jgi:multidrug efflux system membrane fusion protein
VVNQIEPIAVTFTVPEGDFQELLQITHGFKTPLATVALSQETGAVLDRGEVGIADNRVDPATGTVELKARFPNAQHHLWPGQFVNVRLTLQTLHQVRAIPAEAVNRGPNGSFVYVVEPDRKAALRPVNVAWTDGNIAVTKTGLKPGETVVTDGQMTLKNGLRVRIVPSPEAGKAPKPAS